MNKTFTKSAKIELDSNWHLTSDGDSGIVLTFHEIRQRKNKTTNKEEDFLFEEKYYYTRIAQALIKYVDMVQNSSKSLDELFEKTESLNSVINKIDKEFKQYE
jgi:hypothetical protein